MDCVFCKIIDGQIPSTKVYEDDVVVAFMDISQVTDGHLLVVPKVHSKNFLEIDEETLSHLTLVAQKLAKAMMKALPGIKGMNIVNNCGEKAGQAVMHYHLHLIPRYDNDTYVVRGVDHSDNIDFAKLSEIANNIKNNL